MPGKDDIAARISAGLSEALSQGQQLRDGVEENLQALVQSQLNRLDLVTREEFTAQQVLLRQAEQRLGQLEAEIAQLKNANQSEGSDSEQS